MMLLQGYLSGHDVGHDPMAPFLPKTHIGLFHENCTVTPSFMWGGEPVKPEEE